MTNVERRKTRKYAIKLGKHVTPELRKANKVEDGMPVHTLSYAQSRYWAHVKRYARSTGEEIPPYLQVLTE